MCHLKRIKKQESFEAQTVGDTKVGELVGELQLSALGFSILNCHMNGMLQSEVSAELNIGRGRRNHRKASVRKRYMALYGAN